MSNEYEALMLRGVSRGAEEGGESKSPVKGGGDIGSEGKLCLDEDKEEEEKFRRNLGDRTGRGTNADFVPFVDFSPSRLKVVLKTHVASTAASSCTSSGCATTKLNFGGVIFFTATPPRLLLRLLCDIANERGESDREERFREERESPLLVEVPRVGLGEAGLGPPPTG
jgi:hypothetical protein